MKEREFAALSVGGILFAMALLRMFVPEIPFDAMTLVLLLAAAVIVLLPSFLMRPAPRAQEAVQGDAPECAPETASRPALSAVRSAMADVDWPQREGGVFDMLRAHYKKDAFMALSAVRGSIAMLHTATLAKADEKALAALTDAMDAVLRAGEHAAEEADVSALFSYALGALSMLDEQ